jgi:hypothetical protein
MSILALYYRIGYGKQGLPWIVQSRAILITAGFMTAFSLAVFLVRTSTPISFSHLPPKYQAEQTNTQAQLLFCRPISRAWDIEGTYGSCFNGALFMVISGAMDVATDVILLLFPLPLLRLLKFNLRQRSKYWPDPLTNRERAKQVLTPSPAALALILSIGLIPVIASTMRLCEIIMSEAPSSSSSTSWQASDFSWTWAWVPVWSQIEIDIAIVAASLPSLSPLLQKVWTGFHHTQGRASTPSQVPTLPGYRESWRTPSKPSFSSSPGAYNDEVWDCDIEKMEGFGVEKRLTVREKEMGIRMHIGMMETSYYDDSLSDIDEEEEGKGRRSIGVPRMADAQIVTRTGVPRVVEYIKL